MGTRPPPAIPDPELPIIVSSGRRPESCPTAAPCTGTSAPPPPLWLPGTPSSHKGQSQEGLLPFQTERSSGSGEETPSALGGWRSGTAAPGALCAMTPGAWQRLRWCVSSWAVARPWKPCRPRHSALEMGASGWTRCGAGARSPPCGTVLGSPGGRADCKHEEDAGVRCSGVCGALGPPWVSWGSAGAVGWAGWGVCIQTVSRS